MNRLLLAIWIIAIMPLTLISCTAQKKTGTLTLVANGEDFIRQGFVSKDGWQINFDHAYVTLAQVNAYQTEPPFNASGEISLKPKQTVSLLDKATTIDLAEGEEDAEPILVTQTKAPVGTYNALGWQLVSAQEGSTQGNSLVLAGTASKDNQAIDFVISFDRELKYICGEYVGENRKGVVQVGNIAQVETTFHFDHIFGNYFAPTEDALNQSAIGFDPLATLAQNGQLNANQARLKQKLNLEDYQRLEKALSGLGHVGEGHCRWQSN